MKKISNTILKKISNTILKKVKKTIQTKISKQKLWNKNFQTKNFKERFSNRNFSNKTLKKTYKKNSKKKVNNFFLNLKIDLKDKYFRYRYIFTISVINKQNMQKKQNIRKTQFWSAISNLFEYKIFDLKIRSKKKKMKMYPEE